MSSTEYDPNDYPSFLAKRLTIWGSLPRLLVIPWNVGRERERVRNLIANRGDPAIDTANLGDEQQV